MICLDTNAWFWWITDHRRLPPRLRRRLERDERAISPVSIWEVALFAEIKRIRVGIDVRAFLDEALQAEGLRVVPLTPAICVRGSKFGALFPRDPADRMIAATALELGVPLATSDERIAASGVVEILWD